MTDRRHCRTTVPRLAGLLALLIVGLQSTSWAAAPGVPCEGWTTNHYAGSGRSDVCQALTRMYARVKVYYNRGCWQGECVTGQGHTEDLDFPVGKEEGRQWVVYVNADYVCTDQPDNPCINRDCDQNGAGGCCAGTYSVNVLTFETWDEDYGLPCVPVLPST